MQLSPETEAAVAAALEQVAGAYDEPMPIERAVPIVIGALFLAGWSLVPPAK